MSFFSLNDDGAPETRTTPVDVLIDREPPEMTCDPVPPEAWPPSKRIVPVSADVSVTDEGSGVADWRLDGIADSYGSPDEAITGFETETQDSEGEVLADRRGDRGARYYTFTYLSVDNASNVGTCDAVVPVPHDQRRETRVDSV